MKRRVFLSAAVAFALMAANTFGATIPVNFNFYVDDYATVSIDGSVVGSYDNPLAAGNIIFTSDLSPGWHSFAIDYANQEGTNFLALSQQYPGDPGYTVIPLDDFQSSNHSGQFISGLQADYYSSPGGSYLFTVYGEGPIDNGALSFTSEIYEGQPGLWAGAFGPSALFAETLSGQILIGSVPEPSGLPLVVVGASLLAMSKVSLAGKGSR
jgi:hypothetical protein